MWSAGFVRATLLERGLRICRACSPVRFPQQRALDHQLRGCRPVAPRPSVGGSRGSFELRGRSLASWRFVLARGSCGLASRMLYCVCLQPGGDGPQRPRPFGVPGFDLGGLFAALVSAGCPRQSRFPIGLGVRGPPGRGACGGERLTLWGEAGGRTVSIPLLPFALPVLGDSPFGLPVSLMSRSCSPLARF